MIQLATLDDVDAMVNHCVVDDRPQILHAWCHKCWTLGEPHVTPANGWHFVSCPKCGHAGPLAMSKHDAQRAWVQQEVKLYRHKVPENAPEAKPAPQVHRICTAEQRARLRAAAARYREAHPMAIVKRRAVSGKRSSCCGAKLRVVLVGAYHVKTRCRKCGQAAEAVAQ